ncbi:MAG: WGR domain-containing protein [Bacteroidota bacterium]
MSALLATAATTSTASILSAPPASATPATTRAVKLVMVTGANNNKFYDLTDNGDGTCTAHYGRVGSAGTRRTYPIAQWSRKVREKVRKGYRDVTHLFATNAPKQGFDIPDASVRSLVDALTRYATQSIRRNYHVTADQVTAAQVAEAQALLDGLTALVRQPAAGLGAFNQTLLDLYTVIPRRMGNVQDYLLGALPDPSDTSSIDTLLADEQATLDVMAGQVKVNAQRTTMPDAPQTLEAAMGLRVAVEDDAATLKRIQKLMGNDAQLFRRAFRVTSHRTQAAFDDHLTAASNPRTGLLWHGSRNENWLSILESGLVLRPANAHITGKMFGYGLYFADRFRKSLGYTSARGAYWTGGGSNQAYLALYAVHLGKALTVKTWEPWCSQLTAQSLEAHGMLKRRYDSTHGKAGCSLQNNEYIVYREAQCTVRYLVEIEA